MESFSIMGFATVKNLAVIGSSITVSYAYVGAIFGWKTTEYSFPNINPTNLLMASGELTERAAGGGSVWDLSNLFV